MTNRVFHGDNLDIVPTLPDNTYRLVYMDPPYNTGKTKVKGDCSYDDTFEDFPSYLIPRIASILPKLTPDGSLFVQLDEREVHYIKVALDKLLGRDHFINEIIWAYDYGKRSKTRYSAKHDTILWYATNPKRYVFHHDTLDREPYLAPNRQTAERALAGKPITDVWWHTVVPTTGHENVHYPTQKPLGMIRRFIATHTDAGDRVLDPFAGSGTLAMAAWNAGREFDMVDRSGMAIRTMKSRLPFGTEFVVPDESVFVEQPEDVAGPADGDDFAATLGENFGYADG